MEVQPVEWEVQPLFYQPISDRYCLISFDGVKYYNFKRGNVEPYHWTKKFDYIIEYTGCSTVRCDGYYDRDKKVIWFFYNRKIYKLYRDIIRDQKLERLGQTFLVSESEKKEKRKVSPKLDVTTTDELPTPQEGETYTIKDVEEFTSAVRGFKGLRVALVDNKGSEFIESLWIRDIVGPSSKLGSFIVALGKNTDKWIGKTVRFIKWTEGKREIEVVT